MNGLEELYLELSGMLQGYSVGYGIGSTEEARRQAMLKEECQKLDKDREGYRSELEAACNKVRSFLQLAKRMGSKLTESSVPLKYDNGKLARLLVQANTAFNGEVFASQLYTEASGQLLYLAGMMEELDERVEKEKRAAARKYGLEDLEMQKNRTEVKEQARQTLTSDRARHFYELLKEERDIYARGTAPLPEWRKTATLGVAWVQFPLSGNTPKEIGLPARFYHEKDQLLQLPVGMKRNQGTVVGITYDNQQEKEVLEGLQNLILYGMRCEEDSYRRILFSDPVRFSSGGLGCLAEICGAPGSILEGVPVSMEELRKRLGGALEAFQAKRHGAAADLAEESSQELFVFHDFPQGYDGTACALIRQLCANARYFGIDVIVTHCMSEKEASFGDRYTSLEGYLTREIVSEGGRFWVKDAQGRKAAFEWDRATLFLPEDVRSQLGKNVRREETGNGYLQRIGLKENPGYRKGERQLRQIPVGVDAKGEIVFLDLENSNFATFICGAARSGKSTLLHTIITGILQRNHPDDVEMWLIDFKMTEFSRYIKHLPPHVRYIILDESPELVYDIIDRLTEILQKRQNIFMGKWQKLDDVPPERYMPALIVVIDEFSVMSQIIADSESTGTGNYTAKMQTLLAKGAALGMRFIFSSQGFTSGTRGLNDFAKKQIQQRLAMKTEYYEIASTLDLKSASDADKRMMEELGVHHALLRVPVDALGNHLLQMKVLLIEDYGKQERFIDSLKESFFPAPRYDRGEAFSYIDKKALIVDGNSYLSFASMEEKMGSYLERKQEEFGEEDELFPGEPRRMIPLYAMEVTKEFGENLLMISPAGELAPSCSVVLSVAESLRLQGRESEAWVSRKNAVYRHLSGKCRYRFARTTDSLEAVCERIRDIRGRIEAGLEDCRYFFLLGFETLLEDMGFLKSSAPWQTGRRQQRTGIPEGLYIERRQEGQKDILTLLQENGAESDTRKEPDAGAWDGWGENVGIQEEAQAYDAREDLIYILTQGPRLGYHFVMAFHTVGEWKQTKIPVQLFRHKLLFRMAKADAAELVGMRGAADMAALSGHTFRYHNGLEAVSFRPFLHPGLTWDGWHAQGEAVCQEFSEEEEYLL